MRSFNNSWKGFRDLSDRYELWTYKKTRRQESSDLMSTAEILFWKWFLQPFWKAGFLKVDISLKCEWKIYWTKLLCILLCLTNVYLWKVSTPSCNRLGCRIYFKLFFYKNVILEIDISSNLLTMQKNIFLLSNNNNCGLWIKPAMKLIISTTRIVINRLISMPSNYKWKRRLRAKNSSLESLQVVEN